jgi:cytosine permease
MASNLPDYVASARPNPAANRVPWYKSTAQTYAGIMLWFVFWASVPTNGPADANGDPMPGGILLQGLGIAIGGVIVAALICHFASYLAPGLMGMKTGLPLAVVGTSTYGVQGGFLLPGFFMGVLQFGWLAVNAYFSAELLAGLAPAWALGAEAAKNSPLHLGIGVVWAIVAAFVGLKGIHYVAKVATFLPLIPLIILVILAGKTFSGVGSFKPEMVGGDAASLAISATDILLLAIANIVGFFATAGAAGTDIASSNRDSRDVQVGGLVGVAGATIFTGCLALLIVAGTYGMELMEGKDVTVDPTKLMATIMGEGVTKLFWLLLAVAAFPPACFSSLIAANSMKNTLPKVNPFVSVGIGTAASIALVVSGKAGDAIAVFGIIGASFGPICGAMTADYLLAGCKWPGPRAGFNPAGWISWAVGFVVGAIDMIAAKVPGCSGLALHVPCPPVAAIVVGFILYYVLARIGLQSRTLEMPATE